MNLGYILVPADTIEKVQFAHPATSSTFQDTGSPNRDKYGSFCMCSLVTEELQRWGKVSGRMCGS